MKKKKLAIALLPLNQNEIGKLVGGFSDVLENSSFLRKNDKDKNKCKNTDCIITNNCNGANCHSRCSIY